MKTWFITSLRGYLQSMLPLFQVIIITCWAWEVLTRSLLLMLLQKFWLLNNLTWWIWDFSWHQRPKNWWLVMSINQVKEGKVQEIARRSSGSRNHNLRHSNPPHSKEILLPTRREVIKRRTNFFLHIAKNQIMTSIIARLRKLMS